MTQNRIISMANQIARNFAVAGEEAAATQTAEHIRHFWSPAMRAQLLQQAQGLDPIAARACALLARRS